MRLRSPNEVRAKHRLSHARIQLSPKRERLCSDDWEDGGVSRGWPAWGSCYRSGLIRDRFAHGPLACFMARNFGRSPRETRQAIPSGKVTPLAQHAQDSAAGPVIRTSLSDLA